MLVRTVIKLITIADTIHCIKCINRFLPKIAVDTTHKCLYVNITTTYCTWDSQLILILTLKLNCI